MSKSILVVGSLNMDLVVSVPRHPRPGETLLGGAFHTFPGGKGANQAVAAARLGAPVGMIGRLGADKFGDALLATLQNDGVDTRWVQQDAQAASGVALITVSADGQNTIVVAAGANGRLSAQDVTAAEAAFIDAGAVVLQLEIPLPAVEAAARLGRKHGAAVVLNPAPAQPLSDELLARSKAHHEPTLDAVTLSAVHAAKGLEWSLVHLIGMSEGLLPIVHAESEDEVDEERRLAYVAFTRAKRDLRISGSAGGARTRRTPSRFIAEAGLPLPR